MKKVFIKSALVILLVAPLGVALFWRGERTGRDTGQKVGSAKGVVNEELVRNSDQLMGILRAMAIQATNNSK